MLNKDDLRQMRSIVSEEISIRTDPLARNDQVMKRDIARIRKDMNTVINFFDREYLQLVGRVERIERQLGITVLT